MVKLCFNNKGYDFFRQKSNMKLVRKLKCSIPINYYTHSYGILLFFIANMGNFHFLID